MTELLPADLDALEFPLQGCRLIEASAGTGKTFTIAVLYLRAVLGHGIRPLTPREILVTTFTELAADELKTRIHARLIQAARVFAGEVNAADALLRRLCAAFAPEEHPHLAERLLVAADQMDEAAIHTIHGWCQRMLSEHAFLSGQPFTATLEPDLTPWFDWAAQDYWRAMVYHLPAEEAAVAAELLTSPEGLLGRLRALFKSESEPMIDTQPDMDFTVPVRAVSACRQAIASAEAVARSCWRRDRAAVTAAFEAVADKLSGTSHKLVRSHIQAGNWQAVDAWADGEVLPEDWQKLFETPKVNKGGIAPDTDFQHAIRHWCAAEQDAGKIAEQSRVDLHRHAVFWLRQRVAVLKAEAGVMGFDDLLIGFERALAGADGAVLANTVAARYPLAMIDEFQDTDALQFSLFDRVFGVTGARPASTPMPPPALVLIGDPKQSIYRFRNADISSYLKARQTAVMRYTLKENYRSTPSLVAAVNHLFEQAPEGVFGGEIPFVSATACGSPLRLARCVGDRWVESPALEVVAVPPGQVLPKNALIEQMAVQMASMIAGLLDAGQRQEAGWLAATDERWVRAVLPQDVAILVADYQQAKVMRRALRRVGVASVYLSDRRNLFSTTQAQDFSHWLNAMAEPTRPDLLKVALARASTARRLDELDALRHDAVFSDIIDRFVRYRALWQRHGILAAVYQFLHDFDIPARLLQDESGDEGGARRLTNLLHLADWAQAEQQARPGIEALRHRVALALAAGEEEGELRLDQDAHLVQILTIHASKGLQFPLVYLPFLAALGVKDVSRGEPLRISGQGWHLAPDDVALDAERALQRDEVVRLAYVALTRAESACVFGVGLSKTGTANALSPTQTALGRLWGLVDGNPAQDPTVFARYAEVLDELDRHPQITVTPLAPPMPVRYEPKAPAALFPARSAVGRVRPLWQISSYSQLVDAAGSAAPQTSQEAIWREAVQIEPDEPALASVPPQDEPLAAALAAMPRGAAFGSLMHAVLEAAGQRGFAQSVDEAASEALIARHVPSSGEEAVNLGLWQHWLRALLCAPMALTPPIALRELEQYRLELEFWLPVGALDVATFDDEIRAAVFPGLPRPALTPQQLHGAIKGFIDLVFVAGGRYFVLDYKSNALAEYTPAALTEAMLDHRYDVQLVIYLAALHRHLRDRLPDYDPARHLGGAVYWFTRGVAHPGAGQCVIAPPVALLNALDACWDARLAAVAV